MQFPLQSSLQPLLYGLHSGKDPMTRKTPLSRPSLAANTNAYLHQALHGYQAADGPFCHKAETWLQDYSGRPALLTASCTAALEMAALLADIKAGDEIILPSFTFPSTANAFVRLGATPVFVDIRHDTFNLDESKVEAAITSRTRALVPVHYAGAGCNMKALTALCEKYGLLLIEDAAQGLMASYQGIPLGNFGDFAAFSFHSTKNIGCGEGGALLLKDVSQLERALCLRDKGTNRQAFLRDEVKAYQWVSCGSSWGLSDINAALLLAQFEEADRLTQARLERWGNYHQALADAEKNDDLRRPQVPQDCQHNGHIYPVLLPSSDKCQKVQQQLQQVGISAYPHYAPLHLAPAGQPYAHQPLPVTEDIAARLLRLPLWSDMPAPDQDAVIEQLLACL
jgi:dTDP-4-amino-4,6-dideoxygalactose transaminase